jgi:hypothetical protein
MHFSQLTLAIETFPPTEQITPKYSYNKKAKTSPKPTNHPSTIKKKKSTILIY